MANIPNKTSGFKSTIINKIIDCLSVFRIVESDDIGVSTSANGTSLKIKSKKFSFNPKLQNDADIKSKALYMTPVLREWKKNETTLEAEIVPVGEETFNDDEVELVDKNPLIVTWDYVRAHDDIKVTPPA